MSNPIAFGDVRLFECAELASSPLINPLCEFINICFTHGHQKQNRQLLPPSVQRLERPQQLVDEIGPLGFIFVIFSDITTSPASESSVIATVSVKPYSHDPSSQVYGSETNMLFKRKYQQKHAETDTNGATDLLTLKTMDDTPAFELLAMAVEPSLQGRGVAARLLDLCIGEIVRRAKTEASASTETRIGKVNILISTMQELNEIYFAKRGWLTTNVKTFEPGVSGSVDGFHIVDMIRTVEY